MANYSDKNKTDPARRAGQRDKWKRDKNNYNGTPQAEQDDSGCEIVNVTPPEHPDLPAGLCAQISDFIQSYCDNSGINLYKASAQNWSAVCMVVGSEIIRKQRVIIDEIRTKEHGSNIYNPVAAAALADLWFYFCNVYGKPPMTHDFCLFAGVSMSWLSDNNGAMELTSASVRLREKIRTYQETGLASRLVDGKGSPVGTIFFLKNWHGWKDERSIIHETVQQKDDAGALPDFSAGAALPDGGGG